MSINGKVWFITGASVGLGRTLTEYLLAQGNKVAATLRSPTVLSNLTILYPSSQLLLLRLDVTKPEEITSAFSEAQKYFGRIDVVYNNAGYGILGEIEGTPEEAARKLFDVNFWGSTNVAREAVRYFRDFNSPVGGRLLQASSMAGVQAMAGIGYYSASKYAIEGISESLSKELNPAWNIKITILALGGYSTRGSTPDSLVQFPEHPAYKDGASSLARKYITDPNIKLNDPILAAKRIYKIAGDAGAPLHVPVGPDAVGIVEGQLAGLKKDVEESRKWSFEE